MKKKQKDPSAWLQTDLGRARYQAAREEAQKKANDAGADFGLEANHYWKEFVSFRLPARQYRAGHELRCEVVSPENLEKTLPGHGPEARA